MRIINALLAATVAFFCWGITIALSGGVAPLGRTGGTEGLLFFLPVVVFALPAATVAMVRGHTGTAMWIGALAPVSGFANFALALSMSGHGPVDAGPSGLTLLIQAAVWGGLVVVAMALMPKPKRESDNDW